MFGWLTSTSSKKKEKSASSVNSWGNIKNQIAPSNMDEHYDYIRAGENYIRVFLVTNYTQLNREALNRLYNFNGNINIAIHHEPTKEEEMERKLDRQQQHIKEMQYTQLRDTERAKNKRAQESNNQMIESLIYNDGDKLHYIHITISIREGSLEELKATTSRLKAVAAKSGFILRIPHNQMIKAFKGVLPYNEITLPEMTQRNIHSEAAALLFPFDNGEVFEPSPKAVIRGINLTTGSIVLPDPLRMSSRSEIILGKTGLGKTFAKRVNLIRNYSLGGIIYNIDPEGTDDKMIQKMGGQVIKLGVGSPHSINPFDISSFHLDEEEGELNALQVKLSNLTSLWKCICPQLNSYQLDILESYVVKLYHKFKITKHTNDFSKLKFPTLHELNDSIEGDNDLKVFKAALKSWLTGSNSGIIDRQTNVDLSEDLISFNLKSMSHGDSRSQATIYFVLLMFLKSKVWSNNFNKPEIFIYADEFHLLLNGDNVDTMKFFHQLYKRIRKYHGRVIPCTQDIHDLLNAMDGSRNLGAAIISAANVKLFLGLSSVQLDALRKHNIINFSKEEERILLAERVGEGILHIGSDKRVHIKIDSSKKERELMGEAI